MPEIGCSGCAEVSTNLLIIVFVVKQREEEKRLTHECESKYAEKQRGRQNRERAEQTVEFDSIRKLSELLTEWLILSNSLIHTLAISIRPI